MNGSVELIYLSKHHYDYLVNIEQIFVRDVGNVYVRILFVIFHEKLIFKYVVFSKLGLS